MNHLTELKVEIDRLEVQLSDLQIDINSAADLEMAALYQEAHNLKAAELKNKKEEHRAAVLANLPEPEPLVSDIGQPTPYPVEHLPKIMGDAIHAIAEHVQSAMPIVGQCVLGAANYLAQTRVNAVSPASGEMPCSMYMLSLADSGDRKSASHRIAYQPIAMLEYQRGKAYSQEIKEYEEGKRGKKGKALEEYLNDTPVPVDPATVLSSDASFSRVNSMLIDGKPSLFWDSDEGGQMLSGHSMKGDDRVAVMGALTKLWDNGGCERIRSSSNADGSGKGYNRRLSMHLMAQEIAIRDALQDPILRGQGFLPRFLFTAPKSKKGTRLLTIDRLNKKAGHDPRIRKYWDRVQEILDTAEHVDIESSEVMPPALEPTNEATALWLELYNEVELQSGKFGVFGDIGAFASRTGELTARIATVLAHFEGLDHVDAKSMRGAVELARHSLSEWLRYSSVAVVDRITQQAADLMEWLQAPERVKDWGVFTARELQRNSFGDLRKSAKKRDTILALLCEKHHLITTDGKTYMVSPRAVTAATSATSQQEQGLQVVTALRHPVTSTDAKAGNHNTVTDCHNSVASAKPAMAGAVAEVAAVTSKEEQGELIL